MKHLGLRRWPAALLVATLLIQLAAVALSWGLEPAWDTGLYAVYSVTQVAVGALILSRHPGHRIGWLFIVSGMFDGAAADAAEGWGLRAAEHGWPGGPFGEWFSLWAWIATGPLAVLLFLWFPDGHVTRRGWQALAWVSIVGAAVALPGWAMDPDLGDQFVGGRNPYAVHSAAIELLSGVGMSLFLGSVAVAIVPLVQRYRRSSGVERLQLRWFSSASVFAAVVLPTVAVLWSVVPAVRPLTALALTSIPIAAGIAILRYRLYDIDLVISRTLAYSALTVCLAGTYTAAVVVLGAALGHSSPWATAGATLAVAAAFGPARRRLQDAVDRRFNRARYDALRQMSLFLDDLRAGRAAPEDVERVLRDALGVEDLQVRLVLPGGATAVDLSGTPLADDPGNGRGRWPIRHAGTIVGTVVGPADLAQRGSLLPTLLDAGALAVEVARLRVELRRRLEEVEASRARIVVAADHERRRIERDLHDGAQQQLVSIGLALRHAQHALGAAADPDVSRTLDDAVAEITVAIDELRRLAGGIRPAQLDAGLGPALRDLARRAPLPVEVDAASDRFPTDIETAAYFCACEGLTNAVKHAQATRILLSAQRNHDRLVVSVIDDGIGGAATPNGSGLTGLTDRVAAHGGTLTIDSDSGCGTTLVAEVPMRVVIAEDQALLREGLARLFRDGGHQVVVTLSDAEQLLATVEREHPDLAVVDIRMPPTFTDEGARAARAIKEQHPEVGVLVLSQHIETTHAVNLVALGGFGYLLKDRVLEVDEFLATAERIAAGGSALDPTVVASLVSPTDHEPVQRLSEHERGVLELMAQGLTNTGIANQLVVSERTVEAHVRHILTKLDIHESEAGHRRVLAVLAYLHGAKHT